MKMKEELENMNSMRICFVIGMCLLLWLICYINTGTDKKNMIGYRSYPKEVQDILKEKSSFSIPEINMTKVFISNIVLFVIIFFIVGLIIKFTSGFNGYWDIFVYILIMGETLNLFDLVVIDLLWWRNTKRIRFSFISDKSLYQNPRTHINSFLRGIIMYIIVAFIVSGLLNF